MDDSDKGKQVKSSLGRKQKNKREGRVSKTESINSLDDLLSFDARILAGGSATGIDINDIKERSEKSVNQHAELSLGEYDTKKEFTKEVELISDDLMDVGPDSKISDAEQQDSNVDSTGITDQDKRISQLEHELSVFKKISLSSIALAVVALVVSAWLAVLNSETQLKPGEQQRIVKSIDDSLPPPEIETGIHKVDHAKIKTKVLEAETSYLEKTLILPQDDISEKNTIDEVAKQSVAEAEEKEWSVNLNSYPNRDETESKMKELREKGIPAEVVIVTVNGVQWFRIRVTGFKTKAEADAYADKVIKILGRSRAWVSQI